MPNAVPPTLPPAELVAPVARAASIARAAPVAALAMPEIAEELDAAELTASSTPWSTIVWNDPVNLMSYVTYVFRSYFGYSAEKAHRLMMQVHHDGRAIVATGGREEMERHVEAMHGYGLWATLAKADE